MVSFKSQPLQAVLQVPSPLTVYWDIISKDSHFFMIPLQVTFSAVTQCHTTSKCPNRYFLRSAKQPQRNAEG